ncbi:phage portal protein [Terriglobus albidus]|uniref:phage portal protein n=1 Tax=Terriglobus albidus TaxID=1592106 RepID=UPI0021E0DCEE|nr:phage portal protein [Terriglobus albidus]
MAKNIARVEPNLLDKFITILNPAAGLKRWQYRRHLALSGAYTGARYDRRAIRDWYVANGSADADTLHDLHILRVRCRDLRRNNAIAGGAIDNLVRDVVGTGLSVHPKPDFKALGMNEDEASTWAEKTSREFELWAGSKDCDITRTENFYQQQKLAMRSTLESGDTFILLPSVAVPGGLYKTRIQIIEADRVDSPNGEGVPVSYQASADSTATESSPIFGGVECDANGAPVAYIIYDEHPGALGYTGNRNKWKRYAAFGTRTGRRTVLHLFNRERPDQKRGVPYLATIVELLKQLGRYTDAEIMAAVVTSMYTVFIESEAPQHQVSEPSKPGKANDIELGAGLINVLAPGEKVSFPNAMRPNAAFDPFVLAILRQIGMRLGIPYEVLIKHFTASYSAARAALLEFWKLVKDFRNFLATNFCEPVYETWLDEAVALGVISAPGYFTDARIRKAYQRCECVGDAPGQIDPVKETEASKLKVSEGFSTIEREAMKLEGVSWLELHNQRRREHAMRVEAGLEPAIANATATEAVNPPTTKPEPNPDAPDNEAPEAA